MCFQSCLTINGSFLQTKVNLFKIHVNIVQDIKKIYIIIIIYIILHKKKTDVFATAYIFKSATKLHSNTDSNNQLN